MCLGSGNGSLKIVKSPKIENENELKTWLSSEIFLAKKKQKNVQWIKSILKADIFIVAKKRIIERRKLISCSKWWGYILIKKVVKKLKKSCQKIEKKCTKFGWK